MLTFLTEMYYEEENNLDLIANFFFSYYFIDKNKAHSNIFTKLYMGQTPRTDIIDDILHYVVISNVPILQYVINTCFLKFLKTANIS